MPRSKVSEKNKYYISKERYYELFHFCKQFTDWKKAVNEINPYPKRYLSMSSKTKSDDSIVETTAIDMADYEYKIHLVCEARHKAIMDFDWGSDYEALVCSDALQVNVTENIPYDILATRYYLLPSRDEFYKIRRAFFWYLSQLRN